MLEFLLPRLLSLAGLIGLYAACAAAYERAMWASYSRDARRRASRTMTRQMTPMQDPAIMPGERMCHCEERKPKVSDQNLQQKSLDDSEEQSYRHRRYTNSKASAFEVSSTAPQPRHGKGHQRRSCKRLRLPYRSCPCCR